MRRVHLGEDFNRKIYDHFLWDDFFHYSSATGLWTGVTDFTIGMPSASTFRRGGILVLQPANTDNNEAYIYTTADLYGPRNGGTVGCACRYKWTGHSESNFIFGFLETAGANSLIDNGGGVMAGKNCAVLYKIDGETNFRCRSGKTTETKLDHLSTQTTATTPSSGASANPVNFFTLKIEAVGNGSEIEIFYYCDTAGFGDFKELRDAHNNPIRHIWRSNPVVANEMKLIIGAKVGTGSSVATVHVDWMAGWASRAA